jgi:hypothetical protein
MGLAYLATFKIRGGRSCPTFVRPSLRTFTGETITFSLSVGWEILKTSHTRWLFAELHKPSSWFTTYIAVIRLVQRLKLQSDSQLSLGFLRHVVPLPHWAIVTRAMGLQDAPLWVSSRPF